MISLQMKSDKHGSRENDNRFSKTEAAKTRPSIMRGVREHATRKNVLDFKPLKMPWAFQFFKQDIGLVLRLRHGRFALVFKKLSIFQKSDRLRKTVSETGLDPRLSDIRIAKKFYCKQ